MNCINTKVIIVGRVRLARILPILTTLWAQRLGPCKALFRLSRAGPWWLEMVKIILLCMFEIAHPAFDS
jgi:hypothetical protein